MKKIISLIVAILLMLPVLSFADGERTTVSFSNYNNAADGFLITVTANDDAFEGGEILIDNTVSHKFVGDGAGQYTILVNTDKVERACTVPVKITANYGGDDKDVIEENVNIVKMKKTVTMFTYNDTYFKKDSALNSASNTCSEVDENGVFDTTARTFTIAYTQKSNEDIRIGYVRDDGKNTNPSGSMYTLEFEAHFKNGDSDAVETPKGFFGIAFRQDNVHDPSGNGYPTNSITGTTAAEGGTTLIFKDNGRLTGTDEPYYTNTWYKLRFVIDSVTKDESGKLVGGMKIYIAEKDGDRYGDFRLLKDHKNFTLNNIKQWRVYPRSLAAGGTITFKNFDFISETPEDTWYISSSSYENGKINLAFSEDLGDVKNTDIKVFSCLYTNANGEIVPEEIAIDAVLRVDDGVYELVPAKTLLPGKNYDVRFKNGMISASGGRAFKEPLTDDNGDGFWSVATVKTAPHSLSVANVKETSNDVEVTFNNTRSLSGYASVVWYDSDGNMVDISMLPISPADGATVTFARGNSAESFSVKVFVYALTNDSESINYGAVSIYDFR